MKHAEKVTAYNSYIRHIADQMNLKEWVILLSHDPPDNKDALASIYCTPGRKRATIYLSKHFLKSTPEEQRQTIVHEMVHCHFAGAERPCRDTLQEPSNALFVYAFEIGVDAMSELIAPSMPLPETQS